MILETEV